ncbi:ISL3 family transposase [Methanolobus sp. WCC1]|jgi:transposase|uniref:Transposase family protein n=1 Tax=Methanolobus tindarius DSM 2278 TaxID=1090322 RepID=W9DNR3_METTI|nr:ISL3 family transposase [Methanolobus tindarius]ETA66605.1 transposase family protein [Methanolobus tindarius DSM 2278]ETA66827.1 transposase family protein [Methanolobus tindarius DSM 2278]ETA69513.1 transposase family protein [Methanolobus tindarius DSM 2278]MDK2827202.1 transposase [Methanolobus sp.]
MDDKLLIQMALGITPPWYVKDIDLNVSKKRMDIYLDFTKGTKFPCPVCNKLCDLHDTKEKVWRHLDFFHHETYIHARVPRTKCDGDDVKLVEVPWTRQNTGFTLFFEALIVAMSKEMSVSSIAELINIHENSVWIILAHYVEEARAKMDLSELDTIGVDEISVKKGHSYVTLFYDLNQSRVIHIENGKKRSVFKNFREVLSRKIDPDNIKYISMDMYPAFRGGAREYFPNAKIVYDKFHIVKMMNDAIDKVRRKEYQTNKDLGKTRFMWLKNPENLSDREIAKIRSIKDLDTKTAKAYRFKLGLQRLWDIKNIEVAREYLDKWHYWGTHSNIKEIITLAKMIKRNSHGILESIKQGISNGVVEGLNNKIKTAFKRSYGLKTEKCRNTMIFLMAGKLRLPTRC